MELIVSAASQADQGLDLYIVDAADQERRPFVVTENSEWELLSPNKTMLHLPLIYQDNIKLM